jgi:hypothetical protein
LNSIRNIDVCDVIWKQAMLTVSSGELGVRIAVDLALPAFLSSAHGGAEFTLGLLLIRLRAMSAIFYPSCVVASLEWQNRFRSAVRASVQKAWDESVVNRKHEEVLSSAQDQSGHAPFLAAAAPHFRRLCKPYLVHRSVPDFMTSR